MTLNPIIRRMLFGVALLVMGTTLVLPQSDAVAHEGIVKEAHQLGHPVAQPVLSTQCCVFETVDMKVGRVRYLARHMDDRSKKVREALGLEGWGPPVTVRMVYDFEELHDDGTVPEVKRLRGWVGGVAFPERRIVVVRTRNRPLEDVEATLRHELVHVYVGERSQFAKLPRWFSEGVAMVFADDSFQDHLRTTLMAASRDRLPSIGLLTDYFPNDPGSVDLAYATSHAFLAYVMSQGGGPTLVRRILDRVITGFSFDRAFQREMGVSVQSMEDQWLGTMESGSWLPWLWSIPNLLWFSMSLLFLAGWLRFRRDKARAMARMEEQERALDAAFFARQKADETSATPTGEEHFSELEPRPQASVSAWAPDEGYLTNVDGGAAGIERIVDPSETIH